VNPGNKLVSFKNLSPEILEIWREKYPRGYADYMSDIRQIPKPDGTYFYAVTLTLPDCTYLVKVDVKIDTDYEEVEKDIFGGGSDSNNSDNDEFPDTGDESAEFADESESEDGE